MKLATFKAGHEPEIGIVRGDHILSLSRTAPQLATSMIDLIARWPEIEGEVRRIDKSAGGAMLPLVKEQLLAPIPRPGKIMAIGLNYADHVAEAKAQTPTVQAWFCKHVTAVNPPYAPMQIPKVSEEIDYEAEMVVVVGKGGRNITTAEAPSRVFGYCVGNDGSTRDWQRATTQWMLGKSFDTHAPFGPWITTADEVGDPHRLGIRCFVNGEKRQDSNTKYLIFNVWDELAHISQAMTMEPGDLIFTGTSSGVGAAMNPKRYLKEGDIVRVEMDELGTIEARMVKQR